MRNLLALLLCLSAANAQSRFALEILRRPVFADAKRSLTTGEAFHASLNRARAPGGIVTLFTCETRAATKEWNPRGESLDEILNQIVATDRNYRWEVQNDSVNLLPTTGEPILLQTQIGQFKLKTSSSLDAIDLLMKRSEVKAAMLNLHLRGGLTIINYMSSQKEFTVNFKGGTLRQALNTIATSQGTDIWQYTETHCGERNEVTIKF